MPNNNHYSQKITFFHCHTTPESGKLDGYAAIIAAFEMPVRMVALLVRFLEQNQCVAQNCGGGLKGFEVGRCCGVEEEK